MISPQVLILTATLLGAAALWMSLPQGHTPRRRMAGMLLGFVALGLFAAQFEWLGDWVSDSLFFPLAITSVVAAAATITMRSPVYSAIWFALTLLATSGLLLLAGAQFLAVATVVVYAGAILVTFLFVLMLAQPQGDVHYDRVSWEAMLSAGTGAVLVGLLTLTVTSVYRPAKDSANSAATAGAIAADTLAEQSTPTEAMAVDLLHPEHAEHLGRRLFGTYLVGIEVAGVLLLVALVGAAAIVAHDRPKPAAAGGGRHG